jgi:hypothetical protein
MLVLGQVAASIQLAKALGAGVVIAGTSGGRESTMPFKRPVPMLPWTCHGRTCATRFGPTFKG